VAVCLFITPPPQHGNEHNEINYALIKKQFPCDPKKLQETTLRAVSSSKMGQNIYPKIQHDR
jgi:hypothetical protein